MVLCLHGYTNNANFQMGYSGFNDVADEHGFMVVYPQGLPDELGINHWNADLDPEDVNDLGFIETLLDELIANNDADPSRLYSCGFSNGGIMSYTMACEITDRLAAVASVSGTMITDNFDVCTPSRAFPVMHVHGNSDLIVPYNGGGISEDTGFGALKSVDETIEFWTTTNANCGTNNSSNLPNTSVLDFCTVNKTVYSNCDNDIECWKYEINGGGHSWPGAFPLVVVGNTNQDIEASAEIWDFFSMYTLPESVNAIAVNTDQSNELLIYPNPGSAQIFLALSADLNELGQIELYNSTGQLVYSDAATFSGNNPVQLSLDRLPQGIYSVIIKLSESVYKEQLIIE